MKSNYNQLGQYIEMVSRTNSDLKYGIEDVRGCSNTKQMMQTRANLIGRTYEKFIVLRPQEFVFNRRTTRNGEKIGMAYNNTDREYIFTNDYVAFRVKQEYLDKLLPDYLYMFFCRDEFDRYARYKSTGSATEFFNWEDMCAVPFEIPPMDFQQLVVNAYKVLNERIETKQKINDNLVACIDTIFNEQFGNFKALAESSTANTDFSSLPDGWTIENAVHSFDISIGKTPPRSEPEWFTSNQTDNVWISIADMKTNSPFIFKSAEYLTNEAVKKHNVKIVPANSVLLSFKMTVGRVAIVTNEVTTNEAIAHFPCTSRRGDKIAIALLEDYEEGLVSNVYTVFEVIDTEKLLPEYLMLWFSRPEFDRYARFKSHGSVREVMDWEEMCKVELPVPDIEKQRKIVKAYKTITDRIALKQKINDNLAA